MKCFVVCLVVALCIVVRTTHGLSNLETLRMGITRQKNAVQSTINQLDRSKRDLSFDLSRKLSDLKISSMESINAVTNPALRDIETSTKESTSKGKDATACYEAARSRLRDLSITGFADLDTCRENARQIAQPALNNIDATIQAGRAVVLSLDSIFISCLSGSTFQMEACIVGKLPGATESVKQIQATADAVRSSGTSAIGSAQTSASACNQGPVSTVSQGTSDARIQATKCIAAL